MPLKYTRDTLLTTAPALNRQLASADLCLIDVRPAEDFATGHIPGAVHFDLFGLSLIDTREAPLKAFMHMIHHVLELRGVSETKAVVFYEENSGMRAARGVWFSNTSAIRMRACSTAGCRLGKLQAADHKGSCRPEGIYT